MSQKSQMTHLDGRASPELPALHGQGRGQVSLRQAWVFSGRVVGGTMGICSRESKGRSRGAGPWALLGQPERPPPLPSVIALSLVSRRKAAARVPTSPGAAGRALEWERPQPSDGAHDSDQHLALLCDTRSCPGHLTVVTGHRGHLQDPGPSETFLRGNHRDVHRSSHTKTATPWRGI